MSDLFTCRVCGRITPDFAPWGLDGQTSTYGICACCGVEWGYEDYVLDSLREYREKWLKNGAKWFSPKAKPADWVLEKQLAQIPQAFL